MRGWLIWRWAVAGLVLWPTVSRGALELSAPGDATRQWGGMVITRAGYDDNIDTTPNGASSNRQGSATIHVEPQIWLKFPGEQTSGQLRYAYSAAFYMIRDGADPDEAHTMDASLTHAFTSRLTISLGDSFRRGIEPELVAQQISGQPIITRRRGDYSYNSLNAGANFLVTGRWSLSLYQAWDHWMFDLEDQALGNDRDDFTTVASSSYALNPRTFVGGSYRFSLTDYSMANATNTLRNSKSQALYATVVHRFNPQLVAQLNAGIQMAGFSGATDLSPYVSTSAGYNFGPNSTLSAGFTYSIQLTEVAVYRSAEQAASFLSFQYRVTPKLETSINFAYIMSTYQNFNPLFRNPNDITQKTTAGEDSWRMAAAVNYSFTRWIALSLNYTYDAVDSGLDNPVTGFIRSFDRNRFWAGLRLTY